MNSRIARSTIAVLLLTSATVYAQEPQQRCNSSAHECEQEIRHMLSGRRYLGAQIVELHPGIIIKAILPDGPAARVDLKAGDHIIAVNGRPIASSGAKEFKQALADVKETGTLFMIIQRRGAYRKVEVKLDPYPKAQIDKIVAAHLAQSHSGVAASQP
jgi:predicted metalloprotease with PDZ domain